MRRRSMVAGLAALTLTVTVGPVSAAAADDVYVGDCHDGGLATIQAGVDAVPDGGTVWVCPGSYAGATIIERSDVTIRNLPVRNRPAPLVTGGLQASSSPGTRVRGLRVDGASFGVSLYQSPGSRVSHVSVTSSDFGVSVTQSADVVVAEVLVSGASFGVAANESDRVVVRDSRFVDSTFGMAVSESDRPQLLRNGALRGTFGFAIDDTTGARLEDNRAKGAQFGTAYSGSSALTVKRTVVRGAQFGVTVQDDVTGSTFVDDLVRGSDVLDVSDFSSGSGTGGTDNTWKRARCTTSSPTVLCGQAPSDDARLPDLTDMHERIDRMRATTAR